MKLAAMTISKNSIVSAIRGAFVADAASMGTHWIHDPKETAKSVPSLETPEFKNPPTPSFYSATEVPNHYGAGMLSPYGELLLFRTQHIAATRQVDTTAMTEQLYEWAESANSGCEDGALKVFVESVKAGKTYPECGADDSQAICYMKVVPVTCLYAGKPELKQKVEQAIRVHQNNDVAVAFGVAAACVLERVLLTGSLPDNSFVESLLWTLTTRSRTLGTRRPSLASWSS